MDLSIKLENTRLYIRVAGLVKTERGYLFEKSPKGYLYTLGGKIKLDESSKEAIAREVQEEIGMDVKNFTLRSVVENFFKTDEGNTHEICFFYEVDEFFTGALPEGFFEIPASELDNHDIRPAAMKEILKSAPGSFKHIINKE